MEKPTTIDAAFIACGLDPNKKPDFSSVPEEFREYIKNHFELVIITKAINKKEDGTFYKPDYKNRKEVKYNPWWEVDPSGFGFSNSDYGHWSTGTDVGSRLCLSSREDVKYSQENFKEHHLINQLK